jgi:glycogen debranching enzyme
VTGAIRVPNRGTSLAPPSGMPRQDPSPLASLPPGAPVRRLRADEPERLRILAREWLVTNGLGGYASGTLGGPPSRRYHGMLIAAFPPPVGRRVVVSDLNEALVVAGGERRPLLAYSTDLVGDIALVEFRLEAGLPVWRFQHGDVVIERRVVMPHGQNTTLALYELLEGPAAVDLEVALGIQHRPHDDIHTPAGAPPRVAETGDGYEISLGALAPVHVRVEAARVGFVERAHALPPRRYAIEESRGYTDTPRTFSPGTLLLELRRDRRAAVAISTERWEILTALDARAAHESECERRLSLIEAAPPPARTGLAAELVLAADQFVVAPLGRAAQATRVRAAGEDERSVIAGYPWFTEWGRDTMISLEGLTLCTGRPAEARRILHTFSAAIRDGLVPNLFPEGDDQGLYHTADATLWFFHAVDRFVAATADRAFLHTLLPQLVEVAERHIAGTRFGIGVDPEDGLLRQGAHGYQLTWMDAKVGDWVVTPRRGKAVEINALWYNALRLLAAWSEEAGQPANGERYSLAAARAKDSFNRRFWCEARAHLYDVVDGEAGDDAACRPNQIFAVSLPHPVLAPERWQSVLGSVRDALLTPFGLRTLHPGDASYQPRYHGDLRSRDAAYHQGTVWPWLIGAYVDACRRVEPDHEPELASVLAAFDAHLDEACIGTIGEIFDAEPPFAPRGCIAQAWSVAEALRCAAFTSAPR